MNLQRQQFRQQQAFFFFCIGTDQALHRPFYGVMNGMNFISGEDITT